MKTINMKILIAAVFFILIVWLYIINRDRLPYLISDIGLFDSSTVGYMNAKFSNGEILGYIITIVLGFGVGLVTRKARKK